MATSKGVQTVDQKPVKYVNGNKILHMLILLQYIRRYSLGFNNSDYKQPSNNNKKTHENNIIF